MVHTSIVSRGFKGKRDRADSGRVPPGQYIASDFPVLSAGPTPQVDPASWTLEIDGEVDTPRKLSWSEFLELPSEKFNCDIHCVTKWSKLDTAWEGVSLDVLLGDVETAAEYLTASCYGGYTTNLALEDVSNAKAWVAFKYAGEPLAPEHGGPARLLVPHLYLWKSAKWIRRLTLTLDDNPGFWESNGYHNRGDPWKEQRYWGD